MTTWILTIRQRNHQAVVVADSGETPTWPDTVSAWTVAQALALPRCSPRCVVASGLYDPTPYHGGMTFEACRDESRSWR